MVPVTEFVIFEVDFFNRLILHGIGPHFFKECQQRIIFYAVFLNRLFNLFGFGKGFLIQKPFQPR